jgi:hypothetical protein
MTTQPLTFDLWKARLREDCQRNDKLVAFESLSEECLRILYESGTEPSLKGIADGAGETHRKSLAASIVERTVTPLPLEPGRDQ